jgi:uncharacterized protein (TIGR02246 family)
MRCSLLITLAAVGAVYLSGCTSIRDANRLSADDVAGPSNCPSLEGYPDCQNGHRVDAAHLDVNYVRDRAGIEDLQTRYEVALDAGDARTYAECFTEDGVLESSANVARGRKAIREALPALEQPGPQAVAGRLPPRSHHVITNTVIKIDGDVASSSAYWMELVGNSAGQRPQVAAYGHYDDQLVRRNGRWLLSKHKIIEDTAT